jgi:type IV pilus assembly protein PilQ
MAATLLIAFLLAAPPTGAGKAKSPAVVLGESGPRYRGEPISLDLKDADLRDVLLSFARISRSNIVIDPDVKGSVTVHLHDVPWDQALDLVVRSNGYASMREGNVVRVGKPEKLR